MKTKNTWWIIGLATFLLAGCGPSGPEQFPVSGEVTYQGKPLPLGTVRFLPEKGRPSPPVPIASDGRYATTLSPGTYRVEVVAVPVGDASGPGVDEVAPAAGAPVPGQPVARSLIPKKYNRADSSGIAVVVEEKDANEIDIELR